MKTLAQGFNLTSSRPQNWTLMLFVCLSLCLLFPDQGMGQLVCTRQSATKEYNEPLPASLPTTPGGTFCDPGTGTKLMMVTNKITAPGGAGTSYSYWPTFNLNSTKILVMNPSVLPHKGEIYRFDPATFTLGTRHANPPIVEGLGQTTKLDDAVWSYKDPNKLIVHMESGTRLYIYDVENPGYEFIDDMARFLGPSQFVTQMSVSQDEQTFAFTVKNYDDNFTLAGYLVYRRLSPTGGFAKLLSTEIVDEVRIDKTGRYLYVSKILPDGSPESAIETQVIDLDTGSVKNLTDGIPHHAPSHYDLGRGIVVGGANYLVGITTRTLSNPFDYKRILDLTPEDNGGGFHTSMLADNEGWALMSFYTPHAPKQTRFQREIIQVATDGSERVRHIAFHQSIWQGKSEDPVRREKAYYDSPRANISRDGRFVAFSSNWGRVETATRHDMFIAQIEPAPLLTPAGDVVWVDDAVPTGAISAGENEGWNWLSSNPTQYSGNLAHQSNLFAGWHQHFFYNATSTLAVNAGDKLIAYVYLDPANPPSEVMLQWNTDTFEHRAYWGANIIPWGTEGTNSRRYMGTLPVAGEWVRLEVPAAQVGLEGSTLNGMAFTLYGGRATWDYAGKSTGTVTPTPTPTPGGEVVWVEDNVPTGATAVGDGDGWNWLSSNPTPFSGGVAHQSNIFSGWHQHYFHGASNTLAINTGDKLFTYIYLDPANPPGEVMLQWNDGTWEHRAYWGADIIPWGTEGTNSRRYMGALPAAGGWVKLEVPASQVGLEGSTLNGMAFTLAGGRATWDRAGKSQ